MQWRRRGRDGPEGARGTDERVGVGKMGVVGEWKEEKGAGGPMYYNVYGTIEYPIVDFMLAIYTHGTGTQHDWKAFMEETNTEIARVREHAISIYVL